MKACFHKGRTIISATKHYAHKRSRPRYRALVHFRTLVTLRRVRVRVRVELELRLGLVRVRIRVWVRVRFRVRVMLG